ncbi:hypothetical protein [Azospirillum brasilense]|uniref:hypothetical protein n=1 Tax=Azospirillum brasilense TaxID=192 RepID=UPI000E6927E4|nr:hypothetical protein [Azospirillum brasilense]NUB23336.1 hypothetical protein [Azospirillum brasilense]NUB30958.1 hypothetical protein [Azospirillum brasilense]RIW05658.1 hypothetical protein D2T81_07380 [Azospirillum brasilense]
MSQFNVYANGTFHGVFEGEDKASVALAMHRDAGYRSTEEVADQLGKTVEQILGEITVVAI